MPTLEEYVASARRLLHDTAKEFWADADLQAWTQEAVRVRDLLLQIHRRLVRFTLTPGQTSYELATITATGQTLRGSTEMTPVEVVSAVLIYAGTPPAGYRVPLARRSHDELLPYLTTSWQSWPAFFATWGPSTVVIAPTPAQAYVVELDLTGYLPALQPGAQDPVPFPWTQAVPYLAAHLAKVHAQRYDEAAQLWSMAQLYLGLTRTQPRPLILRSPRPATTRHT